MIARPFRLELLLTISVVSWLSSRSDAAEKSAEAAFFETKIRPILVDHCYRCHSQDAQAKGKLKAGLFLDSRDGMLQGGESGPTIRAGDVGNSLLLRSLRHEKQVAAMPPAGPLPKDVVADFEEWVRRGATDPRTGPAAAKRTGISIDEGRKFWSMVAPMASASHQGRPTPTVVDSLVQAKLDERALSANPAAGRADLLRRVTFDLTGLPPSPSTVEAFLKDPDPAAYSKLVDALLASPRFGERWGRHWLDLARYADSNGRDRNILWYHAWRYRDYVIESVNRDVPYDQFVREQVAGDLLPAKNPAERDRLRIATGYLALGSKAFEEQKPEIFRMDVIDEQIDLVGRSILGLSIACARCHDHKFDPIPTRDYYALAGIFRSTGLRYGLGPTGIKATMHNHTSLWPIGPESESLGPSGLEFLQQIDKLTLIQNSARSSRYRFVRQLADAKLQIAKPNADQGKLGKDIEVLQGEIKEWDAKVKIAEADLKNAMDNPAPLPAFAMGASDREQPEDCKIHIRGETTHLGATVPRGFLEVLMHTPPELPKTQSGRLELADWLTSPRNPLTARVHVNRIWQHLFGKGIVASPDDFGVTGAKPTHPELLDFLAVRFMEEGWSTKKLIRDLVLSETYRRSATPKSESLAKDPDNIYLWRMSPRRLEAEAFRDAILSVSGRLDLTPPGAAEQFLSAYSPFHENEYRNFKPIFKPETIEMNRRSVYLPVVRGVMPTIFQLFDFASPDRPVAQREESNVPAQSLFVMNNPWVIEQARQTARDLLLSKALSDADRMTVLYQKAYGRQISDAERQRALDYLAEDESTALTTEQRREERWVSLCQAIFASAEFRVLR